MALLGWAVRHIRANLGAFTPEELEDMVREKLIEAKEVPAELSTDHVKWRLGLLASAFYFMPRVKLQGV